MRVPISWLKDYVDIPLPIDELAERLTLAGLEVAAIEYVGLTGAELEWDREKVVVGEIVEIKPHPNADRLKLATVNLGKEKETVVCGAPNLTPGDKIAFARVGARLIHPETRKPEELKPAKVSRLGYPSLHEDLVSNLHFTRIFLFHTHQL